MGVLFGVKPNFLEKTPFKKIKSFETSEDVE